MTVFKKVIDNFESHKLFTLLVGAWAFITWATLEDQMGSAAYIESYRLGDKINDVIAQGNKNATGVSTLETMVASMSDDPKEFMKTYDWLYNYIAEKVNMDSKTGLKLDPKKPMGWKK